MDYYMTEIELKKEAQTVPVSAGQMQFTVTLQYTDTWQERVDELEQHIHNVNNSTPLYDRKNNKIIKDYDILEYTEMLMNVDDVSEYVTDESNLIPYDVKSRPVFQQEKAIRELQEFGRQYVDRDRWYNEYLGYLFTVVDAGGQQYTGQIRNGGWITDAADNNWEMQFNLTPNSLILQIGVENDLI